MSRDILADRYRLGVSSIEHVLEVDIKLTKSAMELPLSKKQRLLVLAGGRKRAASMTHYVRELQKMAARGGQADAEKLATVSLLRCRNHLARRASVAKVIASLVTY